MFSPPAILFDLDDTLVAFERVSESAWQQVTREHAPRIGQAPEVLLAAIQAHARWYWSDPERHRAGRLDLPRTRRGLVLAALRPICNVDESTAHALADDYSKLRVELMHLLPGAVALLTRLRAHGVRLGLVTNGTAHEQRAKIERFALAPYFEFIQIEGEFGAGKPEDRAYHHALERLALPAQQVWFVGDNLEWDVRAPQRHGMTGVWIDRGDQHRIDDPLPRHRVRDLPALAALLGIEQFVKSHEELS